MPCSSGSRQTGTAQSASILEGHRTLHLGPALARSGRGKNVTGPTAADKVRRHREPRMPAIDPDELPKKKIVHEIGQDLSLLSLGELGERVALLKEEIVRLEAETTKKRASKSAADVFFKK